MDDLEVELTLVLEFDNEEMSVRGAHEVTLRSSAHPADVLDSVQLVLIGFNRGEKGYWRAGKLSGWGNVLRISVTGSSGLSIWFS